MREVLQFLLRHGYAVVGIAVLAEQLGIPVPSVPVLLAAGALAGTGSLSLHACIAIASVAALAGDMVWFMLGRRFGSSVLRLLCRISLEPDPCVQRTGDFYLKHGKWSLVFAKFVPGLNTVMTPLAGRFKLGIGRFLLFDGAGVLLWTSSYVCLGWLFRSELEHLAERLFQMGKWFTVLAIGSLALYIAYRYVRRRQIYRELRLARIAPWELKERMERGEDVLVIDLRGPAEWDQGVIPGATLLSPADLTTRPMDHIKDREVVLYCS